MKQLDDSTLEVISETICGSGQGAGGGPSYDSPGPYRSKSEIISFFSRARVNPRGESSTRKWFTLESLQTINGEDDLERVILRLASPREYRGDTNITNKVMEHLNQVLQLEGLEVVLLGVDPQIRQCRPSASPPKSVEKHVESPPDFGRLVSDVPLANILTFRWAEAQRCFRADAHLSAVVMMGSILEGVLLHKAEHNRKTSNQAKATPRDKEGAVKPLQEWSLSALIDIAHEVGWLQGDVKRFSHALRESRNIVHPYIERILRDRPDGDTCRICWQVVRAAVADLLEVDKQIGGAARS